MATSSKSTIGSIRMVHEKPNSLAGACRSHKLMSASGNGLRALTAITEFYSTDFCGRRMTRNMAEVAAELPRAPAR